MKIFLDSNILLYFLAGDAGLIKFFTEFNPSISFIVELETLSAPDLSHQDKSHIEDLLDNLNIVNYSSELKSIVIAIRAKKKLKLPDAIIAATAIYYNTPLLTADKGFQKIEGLELICYEPKGI